MKTIKTFLCALCALFLLHTMTQVGSAFDWGTLQQEEAAAKKKAEEKVEAEKVAEAKDEPTAIQSEKTTSVQDNETSAPTLSDWPLLALQVPGTMMMLQANGEGAITFAKILNADMPDFSWSKKLRDFFLETGVKEVQLAIGELEKHWRGEERVPVCLIARFEKPIDRQKLLDILEETLGYFERDSSASGEVYQRGSDIWYRLIITENNTEHTLCLFNNTAYGSTSSYHWGMMSLDIMNPEFQKEFQEEFQKFWKEVELDRDMATAIQKEMSTADISVWLKNTTQVQEMTKGVLGKLNTANDGFALWQLISLNLKNGIRDLRHFNTTETAQEYAENAPQAFQQVAEAIAKDMDFKDALCECLRTVKISRKETTVLTEGPGNGLSLLRDTMAIWRNIMVMLSREAAELRAKKLLCISNLKQAMLGLIYYEDDHDGFYPTTEEFNKGGAEVCYASEQSYICPVCNEKYLYFGDGLSSLKTSWNAFVLVGPMEVDGCLPVGFVDGSADWKDAELVREAIRNRKDGELPVLPKR